MSLLKKHRKEIPLIPVIFAMGFIPLLSHQFIYRTHLSNFDWYPDSAEVQMDLFLAYKAIAIIIIGLIMFLSLLYSYIHKKKLSFEPAFYLLFAYAGLALMSSVFSPYREYAFRFSYEVFQPIEVYLAYVILCYYTYHHIRDEKHIKKVLLFSGIGILLVTAIGLLQYFNLNPFATRLGEMLLLSPSNWGNPDALSYAFAQNTIFSTLFNPDYLSFYYGMLIPIGLVLILVANAWWKRILYALITGTFVLCMYGSTTASGVLGLGLTAIVLFFILASRRRVTLWLSVFLGIFSLTLGIFTLTSTDRGKEISARVFGDRFFYDNFSITEIQTNRDTVDITVYGKKLTIGLYEDESSGDLQIICKDESDGILSYTPVMLEDGISFVLDDTSYGNCVILPGNFDDGIYGIQVNIAGASFSFAKISGEMYYNNLANKFVKFPKTPTVTLFYDNFFGRGWIWNRTIPLLKKYILLGAGSNNFILAYPQDEYLLRLFVFGGNTYDVKAHNWFLNEWIEHGLLAMLCLLAFYLWHFIRSVRIYRKANLKDSMVLLGFGLFLSTLTYVFVSIANDSSVCTAPVFWVILGLSFSANRMIEEKMSSTECSDAS